MSAFSPGIAGLLALMLLAGRQEADAAGAEAGSNGPLSATVRTDKGTLELEYKGRRLLTYAWATNQFKPYVRELVSLRGDNVLRDAPADHLHHHGLMYAVRINGVNFWEELDQPGCQRHVKWIGPFSDRSASGLPQASFTEIIHWVPEGDRHRTDTGPAAFLVERRTLTLTVDEGNEEVALEWRAEFEVGDRTPHVRLHGTDYNGLGLRLAAAWDRVARHQNSEDAPYLTAGKRDVVKARWSAVSQTSNERATQVVLFAPERGLAGTNAFFSMTEPFTYLAVTQGLDRAPLEYRAGDTFHLDYLVLVYPSGRTPAQIEARYRAWASQPGAAGSKKQR